ncbi:MAG: plasmid pRiA4b ORF-3 family protein [Casimicrobium sp.]|jgi:hypothetical protein
MRAQLRVELVDTVPLVWRVVVVPHDIRLDRLHEVIQLLFEWEDTHLHAFEKDNTIYEPPNPEADDIFGAFQTRRVEDERKFKLDAVLTAPRQTLVYNYDFGDDWEHKVKLIKLLPEETTKRKRIAVCVEGANTAPPEDCGGLGGFEQLKEIFADPTHPEHDEMMDWYGVEDFVATECDIEGINDDLKRIKV